MSDRDAISYCADQVRRFDRERYLTTLFAPEPLRAHLLALYAFNLEIAKIRETVSEPLLGHIRLQWWRDALADIHIDPIRPHPVVIALAAAARQQNLSPEPFAALLVGRERDLAGVPPANLSALEDYAEATSASVVRLALEILGARDAAVIEIGRHIGIAWALTGLLRAVPFHASQRRIYLPADLLDSAGVDTEALFAGQAHGKLGPVVREVAASARNHLAAARRNRAHTPRAALPAFLPARLADVYLRRLARSQFDPFAPALRRPAGGHALRLALAALIGRY
ncbi:MAG: squalene/phytoene synthase family protein [Rhodospirillales bacterium]|nr:squalene/phytoene synthase family protein [Rhodospirillales bacterium]